MRELLTVEEYLDELLALVVPDERREELALAAAFGRVLAAPVAGVTSIPAFDNSAMDGYAVRFADVADAPVTLRVVGEVPAGSAEDPPAGPGECVRIMTGAPLPGFADAVVPVEDTEPAGDGVSVRVAPARAGVHVRRAGDDIPAGAVVAAAGATVSPALAGALAASGVRGVPVRPRPVVAVCATGDELVTDGSDLRRGQVHESNAIALAAALLRDGAEATVSPPVGDRPDALVARLDAVVAAGCDLVVLTGGASVGAYDVARDVLTEAGGSFRHVRVQPGKPQGWARWRGVPVVSLPGNPLSAALSYEVFVRPMLDRRLGRSGAAWFPAVAGVGWSSPAGRRQLLPVRLNGDDDGRLVAVPAHARGSASHVVTSLAGADGIAAVAEDVTVVGPGDRLRVRWL
jgi:molybdopterin molybdotransferase